MKSTFWLIAYFLLFMPVVADAQQRVSKRFTKEPIGKVLAEIERQTGYSIVYKTSDVDINETYTGTFKNAPLNYVLKTILNPNLEYSIQKRMVVISKKKASTQEIVKKDRNSVIVSRNTQVETHKVDRALNERQYIDSIITTIHTKIEKRIDTVYTVIKEVKKEEIPNVLNSRKRKNTRAGHYVQAYLGAAYGGLDYKFDLGHTHGSLSGLAQLNYAYFFTPAWGVSVGVDFANYTSYALSNDMISWDKVIDSDGEIYMHQSQMHDWKERENALFLGIPLMAQFSHFFSAEEGKKPIGLVAGLGVKVAFPVETSYKVVKGNVNHTGYYEKWNLTLDHLHDFYLQDHSGQNGSFRLSPAVGLLADVGVLFPVTQQIDIMTGLYFHYGLNNTDQTQKQPLGFRDAMNEGLYDFMPAYNGMVNSDHITNIHPYAVGVKVGIHWHYQKKPKARPVRYRQITLLDTTVTYKEHFDTIQVVEQDTVLHPINAIRKLQATSIIWFDLDDDTPKLDPVDILDKMAQILIDNPTLEVEVNGHTCGLGSNEYNQKLSERRAKAVADILIDKGVNPKQLHVKGFGQSTPYYSESHQLYLDRRVEIKPIDNNQ